MRTALGHDYAAAHPERRRTRRVADSDPAGAVESYCAADLSREAVTSALWAFTVAMSRACMRPGAVLRRRSSRLSVRVGRARFARVVDSALSARAAKERASRPSRALLIRRASAARRRACSETAAWARSRRAPWGLARLSRVAAGAVPVAVSADWAGCGDPCGSVLPPPQPTTKATTVASVVAVKSRERGVVGAAVSCAMGVDDSRSGA